MFRTQLPRVFTGLVILGAFALVACSSELDLFDPDNLGGVDVQLNVDGTPGSGGQFVVQWRHAGTGANGRAPINLDIQPKNFSQVPIGTVRVSLWEMPTNCFAGDGNTQEVSVHSRKTTPVTFEITCE